MIEAMVDNKDVGFVDPGQAAEVKVETFTFTRYGLLHGHVLDICKKIAATQPYAKADEPEDQISGDLAATKAAGYVAHVVLDGDTLFVDGQQQRLASDNECDSRVQDGPPLRHRLLAVIPQPLCT